MGDVWKSLFEWSMRHHEPGSQPRAMQEEDRKWLEEALKSAMVDLGKRMQDIKASLDQGCAPADEAAPAGAEGQAGTTSLEEKEVLLDELMEIVESIDHARDLQTIGGLQTLLTLLQSPHPSLRWRAAEVAATCVQNNPPVQKSFLEGGIMPRLEALLRDDHMTVRIKALLALSCMVRNFPPALVMFRQQGGLESLVQLLAQDEPRLQRKCLQILQYFLRSIPQDRQAACDAGVLPALSTSLAGDDNDIRQAALAVAQEIAKDAACLSQMQQDGQLRQQVQMLQVRLDTLPHSEWESVREEVEQLKQLTAALEQVSVHEPPQAAAGAGTGAVTSQTTAAAAAAAAGFGGPVRAIVANPATTGAAPAALQIMAVSEADEGADAQPNT